MVKYNNKIVATIRAKEKLEYKQLLKSCDIGLSSVIVKRKLLSDMKFPDLKTKEDFVLWLNIAKKSLNLKF